MITRKFKNDSTCSNRVKYVFGKNHEHKCDAVAFVGGNVYSDNVEGLEREIEIPTFMRRSALDKSPGRCGAHYMISLQTGEKLTVEEWRDVLDTTMAALGYTKDHKYFGVLHEDTDKQHMHIVANRTSMDDHLLISESKDYETLMDTARALEVKYKKKIGATPNPEETWGVNQLERDIKKYGRELKAGKNPDLKFRDILLARVATAIEEIHKTAKQKGTKESPTKPTMIQLVLALKKKGVDVEFTMKKDTDEIVGISYILDGKKISGRDLKRSRLTFQKLTEQEGISYEPEIHLRALQRAVQTRAVESKEQQHEKRLEKRRSGGNLPAGVAYYKQINSVDYKGTINGSPGPGPGSRQTLKKKEPAQKDEYFAIRVQMQRYHYAIARRTMPPTRVNGQYMLFAFKKPYDEVKREIESNHIIRLMQSMMTLLQTVFAIFSAKCECIEDFKMDSFEDGPVYECNMKDTESKNFSITNSLGISKLDHLAPSA
ncbi:relaxase/mobilization nuclease domain-containing protein [Pseudomonas sp. GG8]